MPLTNNCCPVCKKPWAGRHRCSYGSSRLEEFNHCHSWAYFPRPIEIQQHLIHDNSEYFDHPYFEARRRADMTRRRVDRIVELLRISVPGFVGSPGRMLDVGCDTGEFMDQFGRTTSWEAIGVDVSSRAILKAHRAGRSAFHSDLAGAPSNLINFDLITAIDLIEHVADPVALATTARGRLKPGGLLYFETPNIDSSVYRVGALMCQMLNGHPKALYERLFPPQHVHYFNRGNLEDMMHRCGFTKVVLANRPLPWQEISTSFAVRSMLAPLQACDAQLGRGIILYGLFRAT